MDYGDRSLVDNRNQSPVGIEQEVISGQVTGKSQAQGWWLAQSMPETGRGEGWCYIESSPVTNRECSRDRPKTELK